MVMVATAHVSDAMTRVVQKVGPESSLGYVARLMEREGVGCVLVVEEGRLVGIVTDRDIATRGFTEGEHGKYLAATPIREIMSARDLVTIGPDDDLDRAAGLMAQRRVRRLPVIDRGKLVGIISLDDLVRVTGCSEIVKQAVIGVTSGPR
jgi:CBS domain-containing protein